MRRANRHDNDVKLFDELAQRGFALGTDFIVGHPGESDELWSQGLKEFRNMPITHLHAFIYSKRDGTRSAAMSDFTPPAQVAKERLKALQEIASEHNLKFRLKKPRLEVFCEQLSKDGFYIGFDQFYNKIAIKSEQNLTKKWMEIDEYNVENQRNFAQF